MTTRYTHTQSLFSSGAWVRPPTLGDARGDEGEGERGIDDDVIVHDIDRRERSEAKVRRAHGIEKQGATDRRV